jgi:hypothetical protein
VHNSWGLSTQLLVDAEKGVSFDVGERVLIRRSFDPRVRPVRVDDQWFSSCRPRVMPRPRQAQSHARTRAAMTWGSAPGAAPELTDVDASIDQLRTQRRRTGLDELDRSSHSASGPRVRGP